LAPIVNLFSREEGTVYNYYVMGNTT